MELDSEENPGEIKSKEVELDPQENPGEIKSREVELGCHSRNDCFAASFFLNSCFSDTLFELRSVETAVNELHKLLRTHGSPLP